MMNTERCVSNRNFL